MAAAMEQGATCAVCGGPLPASRGTTPRVVCSDTCRRERMRQQCRANHERRRLRHEEFLERLELAPAPEPEVVEVVELVQVEPEAPPVVDVDALPPPVCARGECRLWVEGHGCVNDLVERGGEHTLEQIGDMFGVTRERIRQIEAKALKKLSHPAHRRALEELLSLAADSERPSTPLGRMQGVGPSLGGHVAPHGGEARGLGKVVAEVDRVPMPCRHPAAPHVAPPPATRALHGLPPSLAGHADDLLSDPRRRPYQRAPGKPKGLVAIAEWRRGEGCYADRDVSIPEVSPHADADGDAQGTTLDHEAVEPIPQATVDALVDLGIAPPQLASDNDCNDAAQGREEMEEQMTVSQMIDRLLEIEKEQAALVEEQQRLLADPDVERLIEMLQGMKRGPSARPQAKAQAATPTSTPTPTAKPAVPQLMSNGRARSGTRLAQVEAELGTEPKSYRAIAAAIGQRESDCNACLRILVEREKAVKTGPGMFKRAA